MIRTPQHLAASIVALLVFAFTSQAVAQAPASLPVQGYLTDTEGTPLEGTADLTFTIYNASGESIFTTTQTASLERGAFSVLLGGQGNALDLALFRDNSVLELGISVDGGEELSPRFEIATSPFAGFAQYAGDAATLEGLAATDFARASDSLGGLSCSAGDVPTWDGSAWGCGAASDTLSDIGCMAGQVAKFDGTAWTCTGEFAVAANLATVATTGSFADLANVPADLADGDNDTTYTAGAGLTLANTQFALDYATLDGRWVNSGEADSITAAMIANGAVGSAELATGAVTSTKIANDAVTSAKVADDSLTANDIAANSITGSELANDSVGFQHLDFLTGLTASDFDAVPSDQCPFGTASVDLPDCDEVLPGSYCDYDIVPGVTLDGSLDNCGIYDVYIRSDW
jgi:hypothetical protein